ncbi:MAG: hypothetical protein ACK6DA_03890 [Candidatus Kapaibacterium sp.]
MKKFIYVLLFGVFALYSASTQTIQLEKVTGIPGASVTSIAQTSDGDIFIGTPYGLWKTNPAFSQWDKIPTSIFQDSLIGRLTVTSNGNILAGTRKGLYLTENKGGTWTNVGGSFVNKNIHYLYSQSDGLVFAGVYKKLYRSLNNGKTWSVFGDTAVRNSKVILDTVAGLASGIRAANGTYIVKDFTSPDGITFTKMPSDYSMCAGMAEMMMDTNKTIYGFKHDNVNGNNNYLLMSTDNGLTWHYRSRTKRKLQQFSLEYNQEEFPLYIGSMIPLGNNTFLHSLFGELVTLLALQKSSSTGTWSIVEVPNKVKGLPSRYVTCFHRLASGDIVAGTIGTGLYISKDNGMNWSQYMPPLNNPLVTAIKRNSKNTMTFVGTFGGVYYSTDTEQWVSIGHPENETDILELVPAQPDDIVIRTYTGLYGYSFMTKNWRSIKLPAQHVSVTTLGVKDDAMIIYSSSTTESSLNKSTNAGISWAKSGTNPPTSITTISSVKGSDLVVATSLYFSRSTFFSFNKSMDTWFTYSDGFSQDPKKRTKTYDVAVTRPTQVFMASEDGIYSFDFGLTRWTKPPSIFKGISMQSIAMNLVGNVYAAGQGALFEYDENTDLWVRRVTDNRFYSLCGTDVRTHVYCAELWGGLYKSTTPAIIISVPEQTSPLNEAKDITHINTPLQWKQSTYAEQYYLQISTTPDFSTFIVNDSSIKALNYTAKNLEYSRQYYWRVKGLLGSLSSDWSPVRSFTTQAVYPAKLTLSSPPNASVGQTLENLLRWNKGAEADTFAVQLSMSVDFSVLHAQDSTLTNNVFPIKDLKNSTQYFWRVRGKNRAGYGPWSETWSFTTQSPSGIREDDNSGMSVTVQNNHVILHYGAYSQSVKGIRITDIRGKTILSQTIEQGQGSSDFDMSGMSKGYYVVILDTHTGSISRNIIME